MSPLSLLLGLRAPVEAPPWHIVSAYDLSALSASADVPADQEAWAPASGMVKGCGVVKGADGLGVVEAQAMSSQLAPTLALVLERRAGSAVPATRESLRVALGQGGPSFQLQPAVLPRAVHVRLDGDADPRHMQLAETQLRMSLCLEHKTGRAWIGGDSTSLRQAFLLDPAEVGGPDRRYFAGQRDAVPALLGPPDACLAEAGSARRADQPAPGSGALALIPSDVWDAGVRGCGEAEQPGKPAASAILGLTAGNLPQALQVTRPRAWEELHVTLRGGPADADVRADLRWNGETIALDRSLFPEVEGVGHKQGGMMDLLASAPYLYPSFGPPGDEDRYVVLLVPNWQLVEGLRRLDADAPDRPLPRLERGVVDGVGWVLQHPDLLFVQAPARQDSVAEDALGSGAEESWANLADALSGGRGARAWGYTVAGGEGAGPVLLLGQTPPSTDLALLAHRARQQAHFTLGAIALGLACLLGLRRLRDLWTRIPEERVDYWPEVEPAARRRRNAGTGEGGGSA